MYNLRSKYRPADWDYASTRILGDLCEQLKFERRSSSSTQGQPATRVYTQLAQLARSDACLGRHLHDLFRLSFWYSLSQGQDTVTGSEDLIHYYFSWIAFNMSSFSGMFI